MQLALNIVADWTDSHGFRFSVEKSYAVLFRRTRRVFPKPSLTLYVHPLSGVREVRFLSMIFDERLTFLLISSRCFLHVKILLISSVTCSTLLWMLIGLLYFVFIWYLSVLNWITVFMSIVLFPLIPYLFWTQSNRGPPPGNCCISFFSYS